MTIVIVNPLFYRLWDQLGLYAYWRILWLIPVIPVVASIVPMITEKMQKPWMKGIAAVAGVTVVLMGGTFLYRGPGGSFVRAANATKLPDDVVRIADRLLEIDSKPRVVLQHPLGVYMRQYSGSIDTLFGRDIDANFIGFPTADAILAHRALSDQDEDKGSIAQYMLDDGFDYLIFNGNAGESFELVDTIRDYSIYKAAGIPNVIKKRNDLGQVVSCTYVDSDGNPVNNENEYSTVSYAYDSNGYLSRLFFSDKSGNGICGKEEKRDINGEVIESYDLDSKGTHFEQLAGFYGYVQEFNQEYELYSRTYVDENKKPINRTEGFAKAVWEKQNSITSVVFYDVDGNRVDPRGINLVLDQDGKWSEWMTPRSDSENSCFTIGTVNLGEKAEGDIYACQIEVEFRNVAATEGREFRFRAQGTADNSWYIGNVWNDLFSLTEPLVDGAYKFECTTKVNEKMADASSFDIGFRCDNWNTGSFRVRKTKIEKNDKCSEWSQGL